MQLRYGLLAELVAAPGEGDALAAFEGAKPPQDQARGAAPARPEEDGADATLAYPAGKEHLPGFRRSFRRALLGFPDPRHRRSAAVQENDSRAVTEDSRADR